MRVIQLIVAVALCSLTVHVPSAWAINTTCANAEYLFPGEVAEDVLPASGSSYFKTAVVKGRSYSVAAWAPFTDTSEVPLVHLDINLHRFGCASVAESSSTSGSEPSVTVATHIGRRRTIIPDFTGTMEVEVANQTAWNYTIHVRVVETTLFSPWWFVGGTNQAFVEIRNNTSSRITLNATFFQSNGSVCGSSAVNLPENGNTAISIGVLGTCAAAVSGSAQIAFQGAPGGVVANITTIDGVQGTSFDSPFTPRMDWSGFKR